jgi:hypothetical protein
MRGRGAATVLLVVVAGAGCAFQKVNEPIVCTAIAVSSLNVTVRDTATGAPVCDAAVVAVQSDARYELRRTGDCRYAGPEERAGVFEVRATRGGYETAAVAGVRVGRDECHVIPVVLTIDLTPS